MRLGVLGPLLVVGDEGREIRVMAARQRTLLAALLVHANRIVPVEQLSELVWDGAPPDKAPRTLSAYVARLRRVLGPGVAARIETRDPGYLVHAGRDELDLLAFEALCRDAAAALRADRWSEAADASAAALGLWRAEPLLDVSSEALRQACLPGLEQSRLQVLEDGAEAALNLGRHELLVPRLRELTATHPLRERFHGHLMLALARAGRQAEALEAYQDARRVLVRELGIEPGPHLRRLQERILAADPEVTDAPATKATPERESGDAPGRSSTPVPHQLPASTGHFTGRAAELDALVGLLGRQARADGRDGVGDMGGTVVISAVDGMAGIGKTALAIHAAHRLARRYPDGQLFLDLHGYTEGMVPRTSGDALAALLRCLGITAQQLPEDADERAALYRQRLAGTRTLIVLDNAANEAQVRALLPGAAGCAVLITSRRRLKGLYDAHPLALGVLPPADSVALLRAAAGSGRVPGQDPILAEIADLCGHLPLALRMAAALMRHRPAWTLEHLAALLRGQDQRCAALSDGERDLGTVFALSYTDLTDTQRRVLRALGLVPCADVDAYAAAALAEIAPDTAARLLEDLVDHSLLITHEPGRYRMHDLVRAHARALAQHDTPAESEAALDRLLDYYEHTLRQVTANVGPPVPGPTAGPAPAYAPALTQPGQGAAWLRTERANLLACLELAASRGQDRRVIGLSASLTGMLRFEGPWYQAAAVHTEALAAARRLGDRASEAEALSRRGVVRLLSAAYPDAAPDIEAGLALFRSMGNRPRQVDSLTDLGVLQQLTCDIPGAMRSQLTAFEMAARLGDRVKMATAQTYLGALRTAAGDYAGAARDLDAAEAALRELHVPRARGSALVYRAAVRLLTGDVCGSLTDGEDALRLYRRINHRRGEGNARIALGRARCASGAYQDAIAEMEAALALFREIGARGNEAFALHCFAAVICANGEHAQAIGHYQDSLRLARKTLQPDDEASALEGIGDCCVHLGDTETGQAHLKQALNIYQRLGLNPDADRLQVRLNHRAVPGSAGRRRAECPAPPLRS